MAAGFSYRHLHYFWVVAKEGGFTPAAARLGMAVQTISAQVRELERDLGHELLKVEGRTLWIWIPNAKAICCAIRGQPQDGLRSFISTTALVSSLLGPLGPGLPRRLDEKSRRYFRFSSV